MLTSDWEVHVRNVTEILKKNKREDLQGCVSVHRGRHGCDEVPTKAEPLLETFVPLGYVDRISKESAVTFYQTNQSNNRNMKWIYVNLQPSGG